MAKLKPPKNGVTVRMYRQGHGDCFLLALPREGGEKEDPFYILIDCGYKPGSQKFINDKSIEDVVNHIGESTGKRIDLFVITHEHQDHVNGIWKKNDPYFGDFEIDRAWFAWTEDPSDDLANELRKKYKDQLLGLVEARNQLAFAIGEEDPTIHRLDSLLSLEFGGEDNTFNLEEMRAAASDPSRSPNKQGMKLVKDKAALNKGVDYFSPGGKPQKIKGTDGIRAFVLGPPRSADLLSDEDPVGAEGFPGDVPVGKSLTFSAAIQTDPSERISPFSTVFQIPVKKAFKKSSQKGFYIDNYGKGKMGESELDKVEVPSNAPWRRIDEEWLYSADNLALKMNSGINNTSLVLAFELPKSKKILLFAGDAQRGNWISWDDQTWKDKRKKVTAKSILERTVLYKVGHHGSHNATLAGKEDDNYPNLSWLGKGEYANEFTAMITAVNEWAMTKNNPPWRHPLPSIKKALEKKAQGRVFQSDTNKLSKPKNVSTKVWKEFLSRSTFEELYFDYVIMDEKIEDQ